MKLSKKYEVIIIGGSYAGLSAAMALGRSLRKVLIIDSGLPCNRQTPHSHNFITHDGASPADIAEKAKAQVLQYSTVQFLEGVVVETEQTQSGFNLRTLAGEAFEAMKIIFATGVKDIMPDIKGFADCWGISVVHCPYCHGYEIRQEKTAILANGPRAFHLASLVHNLSNDVSIITSGMANFTDEEHTKLRKNKINLIEKAVKEIIHQDGQMEGLIFEDGSKEFFKAAYASIPFVQSSDLPIALGCELTEHGHLKVDMRQKTSIPNIFACGDSTSQMRSVALAVAQGNIAGAMVNMEMTEAFF